MDIDWVDIDLNDLDHMDRLSYIVNGDCHNTTNQFVARNDTLSAVSEMIDFFIDRYKGLADYKLESWRISLDDDIGDYLAKNVVSHNGIIFSNSMKDYFIGVMGSSMQDEFLLIGEIVRKNGSATLSNSTLFTRSTDLLKNVIDYNVKTIKDRYVVKSYPSPLHRT